MTSHVSRSILPWTSEAVDAFRVVVLNGARQSGKSTLLAQLRAERGGTILNLDDEGLRLLALSDPTGLLEADPDVVYIDEVQRGGDALVRAVKFRVDQPSNKTKFVLAGSTNFLTVPTLSESLAGRAVLIDVWPFAQSELQGTHGDVVTRLIQDPESLRAIRLVHAPSRDDYFELICRGGFPEALTLTSDRARRAWFSAYVDTVTQRDIGEVSQIRQAGELPHLLQLLAAMTGQELVKATLATRSGINRNSIANYLPLLATVYLHRELPAWSRNPLGKVTKHPKVHLCDTGLAASLLKVEPRALAHPLSPLRGPLLETFVHNELLKQRTWSDVDFDLYHWRDRDGAEVDLILETPDGSVVGVEVKAALSLVASDLRHLRKLADRLGDQFRHGVLFYLGEHALSFGPKLTVLPLAALWSGERGASAVQLKADLDELIDPSL